VPTATSTQPSAPGRLVSNGPRDSGQVALTFDMGGRVDPALDIMNWLIANGVRATIFMTGSTAASPNTDAGRQVLDLIEANPDQFALGNHSYTHRRFTELTGAEIAEELERTEAAIAAVVDVDPRPLFRPPEGAQDASVVAAVAASGYTYTVMWDIDTIDWRPEAQDGPTAAEIVAKVESLLQGGSIVLMHLGGYNTFEALPGILAAVRARGLEPVTLTEMLGP
jgi:peptidoglycan/xylan/chitin deacetylase (PgdA/CDA1 family)